MHLTRRSWMQGLGAGLLSRAEAEVSPDLVALRPEMEPLVRRMEQASRDKVAAVVAEELRRGTPYRQLLAAIYLAGVRNVNPRPPGFALHCLFVIHSAHQLALEAPADVRLLPLFYAADQFKASQERDAGQKTGDWRMTSLAGVVPSANKAPDELRAAMEAWDIERAERAAVALARHSGPGRIFELLWRYGARDYRNIGHKAIFVANTHRTLATIGWQHAEPVVRSLVTGLLDFGLEQKLNGYGWTDQCYHANAVRAREGFAKLREGWAAEAGDHATALELVSAFRATTPEEACADVTGRLTRGTATAGSVWDAVHLVSAELRLRATGPNVIGGLHAVTSANALHYAWLASTEPSTRFLLLLQAVGWMSQFRVWMDSRAENMRSAKIAELAPVEGTIEQALAGVGAKTDASAAQVLRLARDPSARQSYLNSALRLILTRADEVHYYKYFAALLEDAGMVGPTWQPHMTAATAYYLKSPRDPESKIVLQARELLGA